MLHVSEKYLIQRIRFYVLSLLDDHPDFDDETREHVAEVFDIPEWMMAGNRGNGVFPGPTSDRSQSMLSPLLEPLIDRPATEGLIWSRHCFNIPPVTLLVRSMVSSFVLGK